MPRKKRGDVLAVVGGQYGSEGKGNIVGKIAKRFSVHVRTGGANAGHSYIYGGLRWSNRVVPVGWVNPKAELVIGRGALVDLDVLVKEVDVIAAADPTILQRLYIDRRAGVIDRMHHEEEAGTEGDLHKRIGSTGEGVGAARMARMARDPDRFNLIKDYGHVKGKGWSLSDLLTEDTPDFLANCRERGKDILLEGTQGSGLSLLHGPWPYVTSHDTNAAQLAADAGIPPQHVTRVLLVLRTYPIRVAGNSGPLKDELSWDELSARLGYDVRERTTVTKKIRRVGSWDEDLVARAITLNDPTSLAVNFVDYLDPKDEGRKKLSQLSQASTNFLHYLETRFNVAISLIGTGGEKWNVIETGAPL